MWFLARMILNFHFFPVVFMRLYMYECANATHTHILMFICWAKIATQFFSLIIISGSSSNINRNIFSLYFCWISLLNSILFLLEMFRVAMRQRETVYGLESIIVWFHLISALTVISSTWSPPNTHAHIHYDCTYFPFSLISHKIT